MFFSSLKKLYLCFSNFSGGEYLNGNYKKEKCLKKTTNNEKS